MITITNVSRVTDNSGVTPIEIASNPVQTFVAETPVVTETRYHYNLNRQSCPADCGGGCAFRNCCCCCWECPCGAIGCCFCL